MSPSATEAWPPTTELRQLDTHRLIPSRYSQVEPGDSVLTGIADDEEHLAILFDLDHATNERLVAENDLLPGIGLGELVVGVPYYRIVNAAFCHAHPLGSRFSSAERGCWYAGFEIETAQAEVAWHKTVALAEIDLFEDSVTYDDYLADFGGAFHDLRDQASLKPEQVAGERVAAERVVAAARWRDCLAPDSYVASQRLAAGLLDAGSLGIVYPSVRREPALEGGTCLACFRPALVANVRKAETWRFTWSGGPQPEIVREGG